MAAVAILMNGPILTKFYMVMCLGPPDPPQPIKFCNFKNYHGGQLPSGKSKKCDISKKIAAISA